MSFVRHKLPELSLSGRHAGPDARFLHDELHQDQSWQPSMAAQVAILGGVVFCVLTLIVIRMAMFY